MIDKKKYKFRFTDPNKKPSSEHGWAWSEVIVRNKKTGAEAPANADVVGDRTYPQSLKEFFSLPMYEATETPGTCQYNLIKEWVRKEYLSPQKAIEDAPECIEKEQEKETPMRTEAQEAKDYLIRSLDNEHHAKLYNNDFFEAFGMNPVYPKNVKELKEWVAAGKVVVNPDLDDDDFNFEWTSPQAQLRFVGDKPMDAEGYEKAREAIRKDATDVKDAIIVLGAEKGLEKLNEFKAKKFY